MDHRDRILLRQGSFRRPTKNGASLNYFQKTGSPPINFSIETFRHVVLFRVFKIVCDL